MAVLLGTCAIIGGLVVLVCACTGLLWTVRQLRPYQSLIADVGELSAEVDALHAQIAKLRTRKAGATSAAQRQQSTDRPGVADLDQEERDLFAAAGIEPY